MFKSLNDIIWRDHQRKPLQRCFHKVLRNQFFSLLQVFLKFNFWEALFNVNGLPFITPFISCEERFPERKKASLHREPPYLKLSSYLSFLSLSLFTENHP